MSTSQPQHTLSAYSYGKDDVRILRLVRDQNDSASHHLVEYKVQCLLSGSSLAPSYTHADNSTVVATDSIKNTLNLLAKRTPGNQILVPETFALVIAEHFLRTYKHIENVHIDIDLLKWTRITLNDGPNGRASSSGLTSTSPFDKSKQHPHSFIRDGNEKRFVRAIGKRDANGQPSIDVLQSGLRDLVVLKSSGSAFYGFWRDEYTTLPEVHDRIFSTSVECQYDIKLPAKPLQDLLNPSTSTKDLPPFDTIAQNAISHILTTFATHSSPSVQATMYQTGQAILNDKDSTSVVRVDLEMPNRHYIPIDLSWAKEENLREDQAEVFLPSQHPSGLIKATVTRSN
jgi:urate oxidase